MEYLERLADRSHSAHIEFGRLLRMARVTVEDCIEKVDNRDGFEDLQNIIEKDNPLSEEE